MFAKGEERRGRGRREDNPPGDRFPLMVPDHERHASSGRKQDEGLEERGKQNFRVVLETLPFQACFSERISF